MNIPLPAQICMVSEEQRILMGMVVDMVVGMVVGMALHMVEDMLVCVVEGKKACMAAGLRVCMSQRWLGLKEALRVCMVLDMKVGKSFCKVLDKQACMAEDKWGGMVHKLVHMARCNRHYNDWHSLSKEVPKHPKKATRLIFPVVFSLKDSLCLGLVL